MKSKLIASFAVSLLCTVLSIQPSSANNGSCECTCPSGYQPTLSGTRSCATANSCGGSCQCRASSTALGMFAIFTFSTGALKEDNGTCAENWSCSSDADCTNACGAGAPSESCATCNTDVGLCQCLLSCNDPEEEEIEEPLFQITPGQR